VVRTRLESERIVRKKNKKCVISSFIPMTAKLPTITG
jgi:hypothetical protein